VVPLIKRQYSRELRKVPRACLAFGHAVNMAEERGTAGDVDAALDRLDVSVAHVARVSEWRPGSAEEAATPTTLWGGVGRKAP
jgi:hypothetical protein